MMLANMNTVTHYKTVLALALAILSTTGSAFCQSPKPNFSGTWELDAEKSEGVPPEIRQVMTVRQEGDRLDVEVKVSGQPGDRTVTDSYVVSGKETDFTPALVGGDGTAKGKRVATWNADGTGFDTTERATVNGEKGTNEIKGKRSWRLGADGKTLTIAMDLEGPTGPMQSKRVFNKK
jgi:hypothetical protein